MGGQLRKSYHPVERCPFSEDFCTGLKGNQTELMYGCFRYIARSCNSEVSVNGGSTVLFLVVKFCNISA